MTEENIDPSCDNCGKFVDEKSLQYINRLNWFCSSCAITTKETFEKTYFELNHTEY
jgi:hypothetical protein